MNLGFIIKHHFFGAFREFFVYNHNSLEFRAKTFALVIGANLEASVDNYIIVKDIGMKIYKNDEDRANLLTLTTKELVQKIKENNGLDIDTLVLHIQRELKNIPRYAKKIDIQSLEKLLELTYDKDTLSYQQNIIEFLKNLKEEILNTRKDKIKEDEEKINSKY